MTDKQTGLFRGNENMTAFNLVKMSFCMDICISKKLWQCKNAHSSNLHLSYTVKCLQVPKVDFQQLTCA